MKMEDFLDEEWKPVNHDLLVSSNFWFYTTHKTQDKKKPLMMCQQRKNTEKHRVGQSIPSGLRNDAAQPNSTQKHTIRNDAAHPNTKHFGHQ